ncbi:dormancy-associated protein 1-like [Henckelia pumila]|uniref:dormancy-associated protein 1-like n=1 Tax=Henckelia pumila TaxID=405737 RepID=UPI003C6E9573
MVLLDQIWDDAVAGPPPAVSGLKHLRKLYSNPTSMKDVGAESSSKFGRSLSMPRSPTTPGTPNNVSPTAGQKNNVWRSVFNPGSNEATKNVGSDYFDKPQQANAPTVYDWLYSGDTRSKYR